MHPLFDNFHLFDGHTVGWAFDCEILVIANFYRACDQKNRKVTLSVCYYVVRGRLPQLLDLQFGLTNLNHNH